MAGRRVAEQTIALSWEAAAFVDAHVTGFAHKIGPAATERLVAEAVARFMPAKAAEEAARLADGRHVTFHHGDPGRAGVGGTTFMDAGLDAADAFDLDAALAQEAAVLKAAGCEESLDVRRAMAAGQIARHQLALDLAGTEGEAASAESGVPASVRPKPRQVVLYVHLAQQRSRAVEPTACTWVASRTAAGSSPLTRSGAGAPTPTPRSRCGR